MICACIPSNEVPSQSGADPGFFVRRSRFFDCHSGGGGEK